MSADLLTEVLHRAAASGTPPPSTDLLYAELVRRRRRRGAVRTSVAAGVAVLAVTGAAGVVLATRSTDDADRPVATAMAWSELPASPLSGRHSPVAVAVGDEVLIMGGDRDPVCPPAAHCARVRDRLRDGAAYNVRTRTWRPLAPAPVAPEPFQVAVVGDTVHTGTGDGRRISYDTSDDAWSQLPAVPGEDAGDPYRLVAAGDRLIAYPHSASIASADFVFDAASRGWRPLPRDPLRPAEARQYVAAGSALVLLATQAAGNGREPALLSAAIHDIATGTWRGLPAATDIVSYGGWAWDGQRLLQTYHETVDGGEVTPYDRPYVTDGTLDIATGRWAPLPGGREPRKPADRFPVGASSRRYHANGSAIYDAMTDRWLMVPAPPAGVGDDHAGQAWVGDSLVVWGGGDETGVVSTGAVYGPSPTG